MVHRGRRRCGRGGAWIVLVREPAAASHAPEPHRRFDVFAARREVRRIPAPVRRRLLRWAFQPLICPGTLARLPHRERVSLVVRRVDRDAARLAAQGGGPREPRGSVARRGEVGERRPRTVWARARTKLKVAVVVVVVVVVRVFRGPRLVIFGGHAQVGHAARQGRRVCGRVSSDLDGPPRRPLLPLLRPAAVRGVLHARFARDAGSALLGDDRLDVRGARGPGVLVVTTLAQLDGVGEQQELALREPGGEELGRRERGVVVKGLPQRLPRVLHEPRVALGLQVVPLVGQRSGDVPAEAQHRVVQRGKQGHGRSFPGAVLVEGDGEPDAPKLAVYAREVTAEVARATGPQRGLNHRRRRHARRRRV